jgi:YhcH/YjgK/YiaL family protein
MIADQLKNANLYAHLGTRFAVALKYLQNNDWTKFEVGRHEIEDGEVFALVSEYPSKKVEDTKWEAHKKFADIQFIISGEEKMGYAPIDTMSAKEAYNPEKDIIFLNGSGDYITAKPGTFIIFFPHDAHQPGVAANGSVPVKKLVIKVLM